MVVKHYRNLNGLIGQSKELIHNAYDKGYKQAKIDYARPPTNLVEEPHEEGLQFRCKNCNRLMIAFYPYCPWCGGRVITGDSDE